MPAAYTVSVVMLYSLLRFSLFSQAELRKEEFPLVFFCIGTFCILEQEHTYFLSSGPILGLC